MKSKEQTAVDNRFIFKSNECLSSGIEKPGKILNNTLYSYIFMSFYNFIFLYVTDLEFQQHMNRNIAFLKIEIRNIQSNQLVILERLESIQSHLEDQPLIEKTNSSINELVNYQFPIDNIVDLNTFEDNISGDQQFRTNLVIYQYFK